MRTIPDTSQPPASATPPDAQSRTRTVSAAELAGLLRLVVNLPPSDDSTAADRTPLTIDAEAWAEWCLAGLRVCALPSETTDSQAQALPWVPRIHDAGETARRFAAKIAKARCGSIARAAAGTGTSRRLLRETLKRAGTYQSPACQRPACQPHHEGEAHHEDEAHHEGEAHHDKIKPLRRRRGGTDAT